MAAKLIIGKRSDKKWGWALVGDNGGDIIATDGGQGYENKADAQTMGEKVISGQYSTAEVLYEVPRT